MLVVLPATICSIGDRGRQSSQRLVDPILVQAACPCLLELSRRLGLLLGLLELDLEVAELRFARLDLLAQSLYAAV